VVRPALLSLACTTGEAAPLLANLRAGRPADYYDGEASKAQKLELLKTAGYAHAIQRCAAGVRVDLYLPALFDLDPGFVDGDVVRFVCLPDRAWLAAQDLDVGAAVAHLRSLDVIGPDGRRDDWRDERPTEADVLPVVPYAPLFAKYLLGRCRLPLVPELDFLAQVLVAALSQGLAKRGRENYSDSRWGRVRETWTKDYIEVGAAEAGYVPGLKFEATRTALEEFLGAQTLAYVRAKEARRREAERGGRVVGAGGARDPGGAPRGGRRVRQGAGGGQ
jgi:hypothetical protein